MNEFEIIDFIKNLSKTNQEKDQIGIGDDCSATPIKNTNSIRLVTTDLLIEGTHFLLSKISPEELAIKSIHVNLSDIAAMGGTPKSLHLSLGIPKKINKDYIQKFMRSFQKECSINDIKLLGGDTCVSKNDFIINICAEGEVEKNFIKKRGSAKVDDIICITDHVGESSIGLSIILNQLDTSNNKYFLTKHNKPKANIKEGIWLSQQNGVNAMMDLSDGLNSDLWHIIKNSQLGCDIYLNDVPLSDEVKKTISLNKDFKFFDHAIYGGEDYCLLFTVSSDEIERVKKNYKKQFKKDFFSIGKIVNNQELRFLENNKEIKIEQKGFKHFE